MLSFDITDKIIRIVRGFESSGKIKIYDAFSIDIPEKSIENGNIVDVTGLASIIGDILKSKNIKEKSAIVSISSNLTIFKELDIPKAKGQHFLKMVKAEMQAQLGIDDTYSVSYLIVGEVEDKNEKGKIIEKVLATACPYDMVENYKRLFAILSLSLKSVIIGCNCISKVILSDVKSCLKMPLLTVQLDNNFLSINLYDDSKLAFSRFTNIDPSDYGFASDYMTQAVNENIFRMLQFQKTRSSDLQIENVIFYGDLKNIDDIKSATEQMDLNVSFIPTPSQVSGCENIDFALYANAVGALYKRNKLTERINLLETDTDHKKKIKSDASYSVMLTSILGITIAVIGGIYFGLNIKYNSVKDDLNSVESKINSQETIKKMQLFDTLEKQEEKINEYRKNISIAADAFKTHPAISQEYMDIIENEMINAAHELNLWAQITEFRYENYTVILSIRTAADSDPSQSLPALIVEKLLTHSEFADVIYNGYNISYNETSGKVVNYEIQIPLEPIEVPTETNTEG